MTPDEERFNTHMELVKDRIHAAEMGLLNALISIDGLFIGAASIVAAIRPEIPGVRPEIPKSFFAAIIACCSISILLVLWNYVTMRRVFRNMGFTINKAMASESDFSAKLPELKKQVESASNAHANNASREKFCYALLAATIFIFGYVLYAY